MRGSLRWSQRAQLKQLTHGTGGGNLKGEEKERRRKTLQHALKNAESRTLTEVLKEVGRRQYQRRREECLKHSRAKVQKVKTGRGEEPGQTRKVVRISVCGGEGNET